MQYRRMPKNGDQLSILGFGCMRLPVKGNKVDRPRTISQIRYAIDHGVNYVDTAWPYHAGESEVVLGKALQGGYRDRVKLATKLPSWLVKSREDMDRYLAAQLERLGAARIDYYLIHSLNGTTWDKLAKLGVLDFLDHAQKDDRIVNAGFSYHGTAQDFNRIVDAYPWTFCQIQYNYLDESYQAGTEGLKYAHARGLGVIIMEPLRGGKLALPEPPPAVQAVWNEAEVRRTPAEWALRWVWNHPEVTVVLSGMNEEAQVKENLAVANTARANSLTPKELELVQRAARTYRALMKVSCTGCGYCLPCPSDVMIPLCLEEYVRMHMFNARDEAKFIYALRTSGIVTDGKPGHASQCIECGECLDKCPQQIPIPEVLAQVVADLEGPDLPDRIAVARKIFTAGLRPPAGS
ncbi:MAG TPA: aldo/keto reductase [Phycisphaerae bacterium]|nr:aldo/keto reductase [Phycisphaerae bacterium]